MCVCVTAAPPCAVLRNSFFFSLPCRVCCVGHPCVLSRLSSVLRGKLFVGCDFLNLFKQLKLGWIRNSSTKKWDSRWGFQPEKEVNRRLHFVFLSLSPKKRRRKKKEKKKIKKKQKKKKAHILPHYAVRVASLFPFSLFSLSSLSFFPFLSCGGEQK